jgi:hypothetical protein
MKATRVISFLKRRLNHHTLLRQPPRSIHNNPVQIKWRPPNPRHATDTETAIRKMQTPPADAADRLAVDVRVTMADRPISLYGRGREDGQRHRSREGGTRYGSRDGGSNKLQRSGSRYRERHDRPFDSAYEIERRRPEVEIIEKSDNTSATIVTRGTNITARATTVAKSGNLNVTELVHGI